jgi:hypothetical protein
MFWLGSFWCITSFNSREQISFKWKDRVNDNKEKNEIGYNIIMQEVKIPSYISVPKIEYNIQPQLEYKPNYNTKEYEKYKKIKQLYKNQITHQSFIVIEKIDVIEENVQHYDIIEIKNVEQLEGVPILLPMIHQDIVTIIQVVSFNKLLY